jgi:hypothetical protein
MPSSTVPSVTANKRKSTSTHNSSTQCVVFHSVKTLRQRKLDIFEGVLSYNIPSAGVDPTSQIHVSAMLV